MKSSKIDFKLSRIALVFWSIFLVFTSCKEEIDEQTKENNSVKQSESFTINIETSLLEPNSYFILESFYWNKFSVIDTIPINVYGNATYLLKTPYQNGLYRISLNASSQPISFIVNGNSGNMLTIEGELSNFRNGMISITPKNEQNCLEKVVELFNAQNKKIDSIKTALKGVSNITPQYYTKKNALRKKLELSKQSFYADLNLSMKDCTNSFAQKTVANALIKPNRYDHDSLLNHYELEPAMMHRHYFNKINFNNLDNLGHPIFWQSINEYVEYYAGESESEHIDGIDIVFSKISDSKVKALISEYLIKYYNKIEFNEAAQYIADNYTSGCETAYKLEDLFNKKKFKEFQIGDHLPDFTLPNQNNELVVLSRQLKKQPFTLLYFWKSDCETCENQHANFKKLSSNYQNQGMQVLSVSIDYDKFKMKNTIERNQIEFPVYCDFKGAFSEQLAPFQVDKTPTVYLVNNEGKILLKNMIGNALDKNLQRIFAAYHNN